MLLVNVSDFVVQDIIEQLWACYINKYGETDAIRAEKAFYDFRKQSSLSPSISTTRSPILDVVDTYSGATDAKRKFMRQHSEAGTGLLSATSALDTNFKATTEQRQQV